MRKGEPMYKLMIVDDEADIREGLIEIVDFPSLGFQVVAEAENGVEGLRLAEETAPDLVITDIRMPLMDGLSMAAEMRKIRPTVHFIILSGYDEFEYARQAIEVTALRYLLKPITSREIIDILIDVKRQMDSEFERRRDVQRLRANFKASLPVLRDAYLTSLLQGRLDAKQAYSMAEQYELHIESPAFAVALIRARALETRDREGISDDGLLKIGLKEMADGMLFIDQPGYLFYYENMLAALFLLSDDGQNAYLRAVHQLDALNKQADRFLGCQVLIGVGAPCASLSALPKVTAQAMTVLNHLAPSEESQVLCITDIAPKSDRVIVADDHQLQLLSTAVKMGDERKVREVIGLLMGVCRREQMPIRDYRAYLFEILMTFLRIGRDMDISRPPNDAPDSYEQIMLCPPAIRAEKLFVDIGEHFARSVSERRGRSAQRFVDEAKVYIDAHYMEEDLTLEKVCGQLHISVSYFSALFRSGTQRTFSQYLVEKRMDAAMTLLAAGELRTAQVAQAVGIPDPSYFSFSFKKHFGISPSVVRKGGTPNG